MPAGGKATRVAPLPCSKELFPIGFFSSSEGCGLRPKVVSHCLLESMRLANIKKAYIILRSGKWDIPTYFADGKMLDMNLAYLMMDVPFGVPYTLDQAFPFVNDATIALGFPDMIFEPANAFEQLLQKEKETNADIVLGLFPAHQPQKTDMVELGSDGRIRSIAIKPKYSKLSYAWEIAVWTPVFTRFMHDYVSSRKNNGHNSDADTSEQEQRELHVADVIQSAIEDDLNVDSVLFKDGSCLDIGTPEDMRKAVQENI